MKEITSQRVLLHIHFHKMEENNYFLLFPYFSQVPKAFFSSSFFPRVVPGQFSPVVFGICLLGALSSLFLFSFFAHIEKNSMYTTSGVVSSSRKQ